MHQRSALRARPRSLLAALVLAGPALSQSGLSGSATTHSTARDLPAAGGIAAGSLYSVESSVAHATGGPGMVSASYAFEGSVAWTPGSVSGSAPIVFGVADGRGPKEGGTVELVQGLGFQAPGAGATSVAFAGAPATSVSVLSDTQVQVVAPAGKDAFGNTLGIVDVSVTNALGSSTASEAFVYTPTIQRFEPAVVGKSYEMFLYDAPAHFQGLNFGLQLPGIAVPVPPLTGAFGLLAVNVTAVPIGLSASDTTKWTLPIPPNPAFVGQTIQLQAISLSSLSPLQGSFTNIHQLHLVD